MKINHLALLLLLFVFLSCKQKKSTNDATTNDPSGTSSSKTDLNSEGKSGTGNWSKKDSDDFVDECVKKASERLSTGDALTYCRCMQNKVETKYPNVQNAAGISNSEMGSFKDDCLRENNISLGGSSGTDDKLNNTSSSWTSTDIKEFKDNCIPNLVASMGTAKASDYCDCMLQKIMVESPDSKDADQIGKARMTEWAKDCLK